MLMPILMPALSPTMSEGKIIRWLKKEGDSVAVGDALVEIETDKATMEVEAVEEGVLSRILVAEGIVVVNTPIALLRHVGGEGSVLEGITAAAVPTPAAVTDMPSLIATVSEALGSGSRRIFVTPLARRLAYAYHIDLAHLRGSGPHGRIIKADVEHAIAVVPASTSNPVDVATIGETFEPPHELVPHTTIRKTIARRMLESVHNAPHFALTIDFEMDALAALRADLNACLTAETDAGPNAEADDGKGKNNSQRLSVNDFLIKACALALRKVPAVNVSFTEKAMHRYTQINIALAVDTPAGLFTPVIRDADGKGLVAITNEVRKLAHKAHAGKLRPEEYSGGTFTFSNLGMFGIRHFSAILNPPQACILAVGTMEPRPIVRHGALAIATMMTGTLSADHRAIDGATAARYLAVLKKLIEQPSTMLL